MRIKDRPRRVGGVAAVVAAFWLGFVCGGGGSLPGAAAIREPLGPQQQEPAPASQPPGEPAPASQPPGEPTPASQPPGEPETALEESTGTEAVPEESTEADPEADASPGPTPPLVQDRPREFTARTGLMLNFVRADGESAFEEAMTRVAEALAASESEERRRQADGWSTYRVEEPLADGVLLYISWLDPVVPGADYWIPGILNEAFPTEAQGLYETYAGAFAEGQILLNLIPVAGP